MKNFLLALKDIIEWVLFQSRYLLVPFYLGLIIAQAIYCYKFGESLWELCHTFRKLGETELMLAVLTLIDITMIANLIKMIISGSYQSFVEKIANDHSEKISSGYLKVKMGTSLIGVSSIHLLQAFINANNLSLRELVTKVTIHLVFLVSTMGLAWMDHIHVQNKTALESHESH